ncbi:MAG: glycine/betaine ABC transporter [Caldithrix sp.]|nr:glycine/betaine ABC transporter [Caldithrix sp.]
MKELFMRNSLLFKLFAVALTLTFVVACGPAQQETKTADLTYVNWAEGVAYTHLAKVILEDQMGYEVTITAADVGPAYTAVATGDKDAYMECWPGIHKDYLDKFEGQLLDLGTVYEGTKLGLAVPTYVTIDKVAELKGNEDKFDGKITGIDAGAGIMKTTENELIPQYDLDMNLMASSGPAMTAALKDAIDNEEWIVVTSWKPHWMFGRFDLKILEQSPDKMIWEEGNIHIMGRTNIEQDKPELAQFLKNMFFTDAELSDLMLQVEQSDEDVEIVARQWMTANMDVIKSWIPEK